MATGESKAFGKLLISTLCISIFAELHHLDLELALSTHSSTILLHVVNGLRHALLAQDRILKAAIQTRMDAVRDAESTAEQCLASVKACRKLAVEVVVDGSTWNVPLEKTLQQQWRTTVGLLFILVQSLPMDEPLNVLSLLDIQSEQQPKAKASSSRSSANKPTTDDGPHVNTRQAQKRESTRSKDYKSRIIALALPKAAKEGDVVTIQVYRESSGGDLVVSDAKVKVVTKPKDVRVERPQSSVVKLLSSGSKFFRLSWRKDDSAGGSSHSPPKYEDVVVKRKDWTDKEIV
ncbi:hypothetical protein AMS68_001685 [Peltaster fructicola]|uniref:Uncharacterized protein n=1 Tax=Peltaster fructicola TaxID=286661 RepID=A0A6H0XNH3_9PEZI|nr:hypothetical protein AMS68_001685 [Peltaster fructicola]